MRLSEQNQKIVQLLSEYKTRGEVDHEFNGLCAFFSDSFKALDPEEFDESSSYYFFKSFMDNLTDYLTIEDGCNIKCQDFVNKIICYIEEVNPNIYLQPMH